MEISQHHRKERVKIKLSDTFYASEDTVYLRTVAKNLQTLVLFVSSQDHHHHHHHHHTNVCKMLRL